MKPFSLEKFNGLQVQANSFKDAQGTMEVATNVVISRDDIVSKRRGFKSEYYLQENVSALVDYKDENFAISNHVYRFDTALTGTSYCFSASDKIVTRKTAHGLQDGDWVSDFMLTSESFVSAFPYRYSDFVGQLQITTEFTDLVAAASGANVIVTQANHGLQTGDSVQIIDSSIGATGTFAVTKLTANAYQYTSAATGTGTVDLRYIDAFVTTASDDATAAASGTASWNDYKMLTGNLFTVDEYVPTLRSSKSLYWGTNEGLHKIEATTGPVIKAGVPPALDIDAVLSGTSGGISPNSQASYRVIFGRKDVNDVTHISAPSDIVLLQNANRTSSTVSVVTGTNVVTVTDSGNGLVNGDIIYLYNVDSTDNPPDASSISVTGVTGTTFQFDLDSLGVSPTTITSLEYSTRKTATVYASIPSEITTTDYYYEIYRTESVDATVIPDARYKLVERINLTSSDLLRGFVIYVDELPYEIIQSNSELYTNPTQEGENQANDRPPLFTDMNLFKGYTFFANCTAYRQLATSLITTIPITSGDVLEIAGEDYIFRGNATNAYIGNDITTSSATVGSGVITVTQVAHGLSNNDYIYLISASGITKAEGLYQIALLTADTFSFATGATGTSGTVTYEGRKDSTGKYLVTLTEPSSTAADTIAESIDFTARSIVKAVNRNSASPVYAKYVSGVDESPGRMLFIAKDLDQATFTITSSDADVKGCFSPGLPDSDSQDVASNLLMCSKYLEAEAVPVVNRFPIGSQDASILRVVALRDSLIVFKEDGIFRLNGDSLSNFSVTALDTTVILKAVRSVAVLNNSVYALTNQGAIQVTDTSVRIISRNIEPLLNAVIGQSTLDSKTAGVAYESERLYLLTTLEPNSTTSVVTYCYNYLTDAWTTWDGNAMAFSGYINATDNKIRNVLATDRFDILVERKDVSKIDYSGQDVAVQCYKKIISSMSATSGSAQVCIQAENSGIIAGDVITVSECDALLASVYTSGDASVNGLRVVTSVTDKVICFDADEMASSSTLGSAYYQKGISEINLTANTTNGSKNITITTTVAHGLTSGDAIEVLDCSANVAAVFATKASVTGYKPIVVVNTTTFYFRATDAASSSVTGTVEATDERGVNTAITMIFNAQPQNGDILVSNNKIYKISSAKQFDSGRFVVITGTNCFFKSDDLVYHHDGYNLRVKFSPITMGTGMLKQFSEFQLWFRNSSACTQLSLNFSTDSRYSDTQTEWRDYVGTPEGLVSFGGWGSQSWGLFPWGGGSNIELDYRTGPAVVLRTWVPQNSYLATFIQPELLHRTAGEPFELQSMTLVGKQATMKVSK